jgi:hypothetical protein
MKKIIIALVVIILAGIGVYYLTKSPSDSGAVATNTPPATDTNSPLGTPVAKPDEKPVDTTKTVIGTSGEGRPITAYHFGTGDKELLFVGGIHGGYEWNTALVAYEMMDYLKANPSAVPARVRVTIIPVLNPDGLNKVVGTTSKFALSAVPTSEEKTIPGRFNANNVDLNRNFDCDWQTTGTWQNKTVSGGDAVFSEPESRAIKSYIEAHAPSAAVVWYSAAGGVFASNCHGGILPETDTIMKTYAKASGYPSYNNFDFYEITGDMVNWFAKKNIPAISVLLTTHKDTEWTKNKAGIDALLQYYK